MKGTRKGFKYSVVEESVPTESVSFEELAGGKRKDGPVTSPSKSKSKTTITSAKKQKVVTAEPIVTSKATLAPSEPVESSTTKRTRSSNRIAASEASLPVPAPPKPISLKAPEVKVASVAPAAGSSSSSAVPREIKQKKGHFPKVVFDLSKASALTGSSSSKAIRIVSDVCAAEKESLSKYFTQTHPGNTGAELLKSLTSIIDGLVAQFESECSDDHDFQPEFSSAESRQHQTLQATLNDIRSRSAALDKYVDDISLFCADHGLWAGPPVEILEDAKTRAEDPAKSEVLASYEKLLDDADKNCSRILTEIESVRVDLQASRKVQETVYNSFQKAKFGDHAAPAGFNHILNATAADTRELIRNMK